MTSPLNHHGTLMFGKLKRLAKQSAVYGLGSIGVRVITFFLLPYYSRLMQPAEYGILQLFLIFVAVLQPIYFHGLDIAYLRFSADSKPEQQRKDLGMVLIHNLGFALLLTIPVFLFSDQIARVVVASIGDEGGLIIRITTLLIISDVLGFHLFTFLRIKGRALLYIILKMGNVVLFVILNIVFLGEMSLGVPGVFYAYLAVSALTLLLLLIILRREIVITWDRQVLVEWMKFGLPNVPSMLFFVAIELSDRKIQETLIDVETAGIYSAGYKIGMLMSIVAQAFRFAWQPFIMQTSRDEDARETYARVMTYYVGFASLLWLISTMFLGDLLMYDLPGIGFLIAPAYWGCMGIFPIIMLAHIFNGIYANLMAGVYLKNKTKIIPVVIGIAAAVNIAGNWLLIPHYGFIVSAWLTVVSYAIMAILMYFYINPRYTIRYEWSRLLRIVLIITASWLLFTSIPLLNTLTGRFVLLLISGVAGWFTVLLPVERRALKKLIGIGVVR